MAGRGMPPGEGSRRYRAVKGIRLIADGKLRGPALPKDALVDEDAKPVRWHPQTVRMWNHWRRSPQAIRMMTGPDWDFLLETAALHHEMWAEGRLDLAPEIRLRLSKFGATPEDRARLRVTVGDAGELQSPLHPEHTAPVTRIDDDRWSRLMTDEGHHDRPETHLGPDRHPGIEGGIDG